MAWQGNGRGAAWERHAMCESGLKRGTETAEREELQCENFTLGQQYAMYSEKSAVRRFVFLRISLFSFRPLRIFWCITVRQLHDFIYSSIVSCERDVIVCHPDDSMQMREYVYSSGVPRNFVRGGGFNKFSWWQREGDMGAVALLVKGSGGSCNLVQEI